MAEKAYLETEGGKRLACLFNPGELAVTASANWEGDTVSGQSGPSLKFRGGNSGSTSGYCWVVERVTLVFNVTARPLIRPWPFPLRSASSLTRAYPAPSPDQRRAHPREIFRYG